MADCQSWFEGMANWMKDISDPLMVKLFLFGLLWDINTGVLVHKPVKFNDAISLSQTHDQRLNIDKGPYNPPLVGLNTYCQLASPDPWRRHSISHS